MMVFAQARIADYFRHYANLPSSGDPVEDALMGLFTFTLMGGFLFALVPLWFLLWTLNSEKARSFGIFSSAAYVAPILLLIVLAILDVGHHFEEIFIASILFLCWAAGFLSSLAGLAKLAFSRSS